MVRSLARRGMPKPLAILIAVLMALYVVPLGALPAGAAVVGGFEIEGDTTDQAGGGIDWASLGAGSAGFSTGVDNTVGGQDDTTFQGSSKEFDESGSGAWPSWKFGTGNATGKSDFGRWATYDLVDTDDHVWFYFAFDRGFGTGTAKYAFELNQVTQSPTTDANPDRSQGDIRLVIYDQGNGVVTLTADKQNEDVGVWVWDDPDYDGTGAAALDSNQNGEWVKSTDQDGVFSGASNTGETPIAVPAWWTGGNTTDGTLAKDTFLEFGIDLTSYGAVLGCPSSGFTAVNSRSITGTGGPGTLVDYLSAVPVSIPSNCASLVVNKTDADQQALGGATFKIEPNPLPVGTPGRPDADYITVFDDSDANTAKEGSTSYDDPDATAGKITLSAVVPGEYTVTEIEPPVGYIGEPTGRTVTAKAFGSDSVTFVNTLGSVTFTKQYAGPDGDVTSGASFRLVRDSDDDGDYAEESGADVIAVTDNGTNDADGTLGQIKVVDLKTGDYKLTETDAPTGWVKDGDVVLFSVPGANDSADVTLSQPTFENPRATYPLTVRKVAERDSSVKIDGAVFELYRESGTTVGFQKSEDTLVGACTTGATASDADGECTVTGLAWGESYFWYEVSVPAPYNLPDNRVVGPVTIAADGTTDPAGAAQFEDPRSAIRTSATNGALPAGTISDSAELSGVRQDAGGSITFRLYSDDTCSTLVWSSAAFPVEGPGTYGPATTSVTTAGDYYWIASYSGDDSSGTRPVAGACGEAGETSTVVPAQPGIVTIVDDAVVTLGDEPTYLKDHATLSGATSDPEATGTVEFAVYGPLSADPTGDPTACVGDPFATVAATDVVSGNGNYTSADVKVTDTGYYVWVASYSGDANNDPAAEGCGSATEVVQVKKSQPTITTEAQQDTVALGMLPTVLTDKATLSGATADAGGSIRFVLYGPFADAPEADDCSLGKAVAEVTTVETFAGNGSYASMPVVASKAGYYTWVATYLGDGNNKAASHACGLASETTLVTPAEPQITTTAGADQVIGQDGADLTDTASLSGATAGAEGTITFSLYGPFATDPTGNADSCVDGVGGNLVGSVVNGQVDGDGAYVSPSVSVGRTGYYVWVASYSGDADNEAATHECGVASEVVRVTPRQPVITTDVPGPNSLALGTEGTVLSDTATVSEATSDAAGTITFQLFGPFQTAPGRNDCAPGKALGAPVATTAPVTGNGVYTSAPKTVYGAGFYTWIATYSGDANNSAATHACGLADETVQVTKATTGITTVATTDAIIKSGQKISDSASVTGLTGDASGTVTFSLYGPDDATCTGVPVFTSTVPLVVTATESGASGGATSAAYAPTAAGTYRWVASYSGDANNAGSAGKCNDPNEQSVVKAGDKPNLDKISNPGSGSTVQPGTRIDYSVKVWNTGDVAITNADVLDILPPNVTVDPASISDGGALSADRTRITWKVTLAPADVNTAADEKTFTYAATVDADAPEGAVLLNTARFLGLEDTTTHVVPTGDLTVVKEVSPVAGGGVVVNFGDTLTYTLTVTASGTLDQPSTVVRDYVPGFDPERPSSGRTTYVPGSATCLGVGACTVTEPGADGLVSWSLGTMPAGTTRQVTFQVVIDEVAGQAGETVAVDILNAGSVESVRTPRTPSNQVVTPVTEVFPVKEGNPPKRDEPGVLPRTGSGIPIGDLLTTGAALLLAGLVLLLGTRRRGAHRR